MTNANAPISVPNMSRNRAVTDIHYGLPSHLSEETFRRFEPLIKQAVANAPADTSFTIPSDLAPTTFVARLRDSTLSVKKFGWKTDIDMEKLWSLAGQMVWSYDFATKLVWYREKQQRGRPSELKTEANVHARQLAAVSSQRWTAYVDAELQALCVLLSSDKLSGPYILPGLLDLSITTELESKFNVSFVLDEANKETILS